MSESLLTRIMREYAGGGHSIYAPSSSARWMSCGGSLIAGLFEEDETSYEAAEGTVAHGIAEEWLKTDKRPRHLIGTTITLTENGTSHEIPVTTSMLDFVQEYVDWCRYEDGEMLVETKVYFTDLMPPANADDIDEFGEDYVEPIPFEPQGGTADNIIKQPSKKRLIVTDLKYGTGVQVFAENNSQALLYAYGAYQLFKDEFEIEEIVIRIAQPRLGHMDEWIVTVEDLLGFAEIARQKAAEAWSLNAKRRATLKGCRFCRSSHNCAAIAFMMESAVGADMYYLDSDFGDDEMSMVREALAEEYRLRIAKFGSLTTSDLAKILPYRKVVENWFNRMDGELERRAMNGEHIPGMKLVESRSNRRYRSDADAKELFEFLGLTEDQFTNTKMVTPAQMEDVIKDALGISKAGAPDIINRIAFKPEGRPTLVPLTDKRPSINGHFIEAFDDDDVDNEI